MGQRGPGADRVPANLGRWPFHHVKLLLHDAQVFTMRHVWRSRQGVATTTAVRPEPRTLAFIVSAATDVSPWHHAPPDSPRRVASVSSPWLECEALCLAFYSSRAARLAGGAGSALDLTLESG